MIRTIVPVALALALALGCGKKAEHSGPAAEVTGLAAVPSTAEAVIGADVAKLAASPIIERAIDQLVVRDAKLAASWQRLREGCTIDVAKQIKRVLLVLGPVATGGAAGTGPTLLIATGTIAETELSDCIGKFAGKGGGSVTGKDVSGHTVYQVKDGPRSMYYAFGRPDTVVLGTSEAYVIEAIGPGKKALDHPELAGWLKLVDQNAPVWSVGRVPSVVALGLVKVVPDLKTGPVGFLGSTDPTHGLKLALGVVMASAEDAKKLESFANDQKKVMTMVAQAKSLGVWANKLSFESNGSIVWMRAPLEMEDVNHLLSVLDGAGSPTQDSPLPTSSGSSTGAPQH